MSLNYCLPLGPISYRLWGIHEIPSKFFVWLCPPLGRSIRELLPVRGTSFASVCDFFHLASLGKHCATFAALGTSSGRGGGGTSPLMMAAVYAWKFIIVCQPHSGAAYSVLVSC